MSTLVVCLRTIRAYLVPYYNRIERVLEMSRSIDDVRSLDASCPALVARATRLSNLYGASLDSRLARKGAGESTRRRRRGTRRCVYVYSSTYVTAFLN